MLRIVTFILAFGNLIGPHAHTGFTVVGKTRRTLVTGSFTVPAVPEDVTLGVISEDTVQSSTMGSRNGRF